MFKLQILIIGLTALMVKADVSHVAAGYRRPFGANPFGAPAPAAPLARQTGFHTGPQIAILRLDKQVSPDGSYSFAYEGANGISAQERGDIHPTGPESAQKNVQGSFSFTSPEGIPVGISYIADDNGFQAVGDAIPTPPPIPIEIQKSLEYNAAHPEEDNAGQSFPSNRKYY